MSSDQVNEFEVFFELQGTGFDPGEISKLLGLNATSIQKGDSSKYPTSHWIFSSGIQKGMVVDIGVAAEALINQLKVAEQKIIDVIEQYDLKAYFEVELKLAPHIYSINYEKLDGVRITFEPEQFRFLTAVNASLNIDVEYD